MSQTASIWLVIAVAAIAANLPFFTRRLLLLVPLRSPKTLAWRLLELAVGYFIVGGLGMALEKSAGQLHSQGWEFYAVTATLFITLAFPGFVYRHLMNRRV